MIHNHSSGKHGLLRKMLAVCIAFAMICSVSISAFSVEASSENTDETVQSVMTEEEGDPEAAEAETDSEQTPGEEQTEEPEVTPPEDNVENPDADNAEPTPSEDNQQPADPTVTEQPEEPTVTEQPTATPTEEVPSVTPAQDETKDAQALEQEKNQVAAQDPRWPDDSYKTYNGVAAIYYLATPDGVPGSNETKYWAPESDQSKLLGTINTNGATWQKVNGTDKNIVTNVSRFVTGWPGETDNHISSWTVKRTDTTIAVDGKTYFNYILDSIWNSYQKNLKNKLGIEDLKKEDVTEITLKPFKISRDNSTKANQNYHIDCTIDITCTKTFTAKFWVKKPGASEEYKQVDGKEYLQGSKVEKTTVSSIEERIVGDDGITYVFDGWYPESDPDGNNSSSKISDASWAYSPDEAELKDGTVNFYAHYTPLYTSVEIEKLVTGNMGDKSKSFHFEISVVNGNTNLPFEIDEKPYTGSTEITLSDKQTKKLTQVPVGATVTITEDDYSGKRYTTSYTIGKSGSTESNIATISNIQQLNNDKNDAHKVTFTNYKDAIPDTGLNLGTTPYILALGIAALGAGLLIFGRRKRQS